MSELQKRIQETFATLLRKKDGPCTPAANPRLDDQYRKSMALVTSALENLVKSDNQTTHLHLLSELVQNLAVQLGVSLVSVSNHGIFDEARQTMTERSGCCVSEISWQPTVRLYEDFDPFFLEGPSTVLGSNRSVDTSPLDIGRRSDSLGHPKNPSCSDFGGVASLDPMLSPFRASESPPALHDVGYPSPSELGSFFSRTAPGSYTKLGYPEPPPSDVTTAASGRSLDSVGFQTLSTFGPCFDDDPFMQPMCPSFDLRPNVLPDFTPASWDSMSTRCQTDTLGCRPPLGSMSSFQSELPPPESPHDMKKIAEESRDDFSVTCSKSLTEHTDPEDSLPFRKYHDGHTVQPLAAERHPREYDHTTLKVESLPSQKTLGPARLSPPGFEDAARTDSRPKPSAPKLTSSRHREGPTFWGMWEDERSRMVYVSWLPKAARASDRTKKKACELLLKDFVTQRLGFEALQKVLLFPPSSAHCKFLFETEEAAIKFLSVFGGLEGQRGPELWKNLVCDYYSVNIRGGIHAIKVRVIWADQTKNDSFGPSPSLMSSSRQ